MHAMSSPRFVVSSYCHEGGCVAVAALPGGGVAVRDHKEQSGPVLTFTADEWRAFLDGVAAGEFEESALRA